jgi:alpha/beta superfamily hydrolase
MAHMLGKITKGLGFGKHKRKDSEGDDGPVTGESKKRNSLNRGSGMGLMSPDNFSPYGNVHGYPKVVVAKDMGVQTEQCSFPTCSSQPKIVKRCATWLLCLFGFYVCAVICVLLIKPLQTLLLYSNIVNVPTGSLTDLARFNLLNARNVETVTADGVILRGYHIVPMTAAQPISADDMFDRHLADAQRIILYLHGNAGNRGLPDRVDTVTKLAQMHNAHVVTFDYRGFGDNSFAYKDWPSEHGTYIDSVAMVDWIYKSIRVGTEASSQSSATRIRHFYVYGHSLGAAVGARLVSHLEADVNNEDLLLSGLILDSPFTSIEEVAMESPMASKLPFFRSLAPIM